MPPVVVCVVGTRPEAVKMAPLIGRLRRPGMGLIVRVLSTGQHRELLDQALGDFGIACDEDLGLMRAGQGLADMSARAVSAVSSYLERLRPDLILAQGDTTTVLATALACYYNKVPFGHVEAGLRTGRPYDPFPEEQNRRLADHLASVLFAPTERSRENLRREGIADESIHVTGNTVVDALLAIVERAPALPLSPPTDRFLLVTTHRRESFGEPLKTICQALLEIVKRHTDLGVVLPLHPNPNARETIVSALGGRDRIQLIEPVAYAQFIALMKAATAILTDSGGVQEEAPTLGTPVLVLREVTERPEAVEAGLARLVGTRAEAIIAEVDELLEDRTDPSHRLRRVNPYGDGWAAERITRIVAERLGIDPGPLPEGMPILWQPPAHRPLA